MADIGTGFLQAISAFCASRLGKSSGTTFKDTKSLVNSLGDGVPDNTKPAYAKLKADIEADVDVVKPIIKAIDSQTAVIGKMASESIADAEAAAFSAAEAGRIATRIGTALIAIDEAVNIVAKELSKDAAGNVNEAVRVQLMGIWNPWVQPFRDLADGAGKVVDSLGSQLLGIDGATQKIADAAKNETFTFNGDTFRVAIKLVGTKEAQYGALTLDQTTLEAFLEFARREFLNPSEEDKKSLVERDAKWWRADEAVFGLRIYTTIKPGLQNDPLLKQIMPKSDPPKTIKPTAVTLDSVDGLYLGDGRGAGNEKAVLPVTFSSPVVEVREVALGLLRNKAKELTGLEVTTVIAAKLGGAVGLQIGGAGAIIALDGQPTAAAMFPMDVSPRWPDQIGIRVTAGPVKGGGFLERKNRPYGVAPNITELVEFGGVIQLEILKVGVYAIGILSPDPFSLVLVMGVRFPTAIELSFGFTFNGVGGILAVNRTVNTTELIAGMKTHFIDRVLFPEDPVAEAPGLLDAVAKVFPPAAGGFVVGPIIELGWGSQARIVEAKLGVVLALPDPKIIILGAVRVRSPAKNAPLTDFRCEVYAEMSTDRLLLVARMNNSTIAGIDVSGDLGLLIQWGGGGDFALSAGGFNPGYLPSVPADLQSLERLTMDLSPPKVVKINIQAYFAVTAGAVMAGVRGDLKADLGVASAHAWLQLDMIFFWSPRFAFNVVLDLGIDIQVFGHSFAAISFKGSLEGTRPWKVEGKATVDVWFLPTFHLDLGPYTWGDPAVEPAPTIAPLELVTAALNEAESWKAVLPVDGDHLAALARVEATGLVAHPLAALEVSQSKLPLETHIDRIGSSSVSAHRVALGLARTTTGPAQAISTVVAPFAPGQFLALSGEALLARAGFDELPSGCRIAAATTPTYGTPVADTIKWHTYFRDADPEPNDPGQRFDATMYATVVVSHGLTARHLDEGDNPYLPRTVKAAPRPTVDILAPGTATVRRVDDGGAVLADLGVLTASEASWIADTVNASGLDHLAAVTVGMM